MSNQDEQFPPQDAVWSPPESVAGGWRPVRGPGVPVAPASGGSGRGPAAVGGPLRPEPKQRGTRVRVVVTVAALVATVGAVVGGVLLTNSPDGSGGGKASTDAAADPNVAVDPPSSPALGGSGAPGAGVVPSGSPTATLSVPAAPPTLSQAQAMASAQAAEGAFAPPTSVPSDVPSYSGSAPLGSVSLPPFLTVAVPPVQAKDGRAQALADQSTLLLKAWVEAWAGGSTGDARYRALCVEQCRAVLDPMVALWKNANIVPAGTLRFFNLAGGLAKGNDQSGEVGVCLDDSALTAFRDGATYQDPYPLGRPELLVFGLVYDKAVGHWVATEAYASPGDSYCAQDQSSGGTSG